MRAKELKSKEQIDTKKRDILKKGLYVAPKLIILGTLTKPTDSKAGFGLPHSDPIENIDNFL